MFSLSDIREIALQIERNGEITYRRAAQSSRTPRIARLLFEMADEEQKHARWFEHLDVSARPVAKDSRIEQMGRDLLQKMMSQQTFSLDESRLAETLEVQDLLDQAIEFENDTILFYQMLHSFIDDSATMAQLEKIIDEEQAHIEKLKALFCKREAVACPQK
jgi:rubrerythrin